MQTSFPACRSFTSAEEGGLSLNSEDAGNYVSGVAGVGPLIGSKFGIAAPTLAAWLRPQTISAADMSSLGDPTVEAIYRTKYWLEMSCDQLPAGVDLMVFDFGFNTGDGADGSGPSGRVLQKCVGLSGTDIDGWIGGQTISAIGTIDTRTIIDLLDAQAVHGLQQALKIATDGVIGPQTQKAIANHLNAPTLLLITALATQQGAYYRALNNPEFQAGWLARTDRRQLAAYALALADTTTTIPTGEPMAYTPAVFDPSTMKGQDFTTASGYDTSIWTNTFGPASSLWWSKTSDGLWITSSQSTTPPWIQSGFMEADTTATSGFGYGTFHFRARSGQKGQGAGINLILWPATGVWFPPAIKGTFGEMDVAEAWSSNGTSISTMHYDASATGGSSNTQEMHSIIFPPGSDNTVMADYDLIWTANSVALYVDGVPSFQDTGAHIPKDATDGGMNRTIGAQVVIQTTLEPLPTIQLMLANCWWSPSTAAPGSVATTEPVTPPVTPVAPTEPTAPVVPTDPTPPVGTGSGSSSGSPSTGSGGTEPTAPSGGATTTPVSPVSPVAPVAPSQPTTPSTPLSVTASMDTSSVTFVVTKATGAVNTLRLFMDGKYIGVLRDLMADGTKDFAVPLPMPGKHVASFSLDGSTATASVSFTVAGDTSAPAPTPPPITAAAVIAAIPDASPAILAQIATLLGLSA